MNIEPFTAFVFVMTVMTIPLGLWLMHKDHRSKYQVGGNSRVRYYAIGAGFWIGCAVQLIAYAMIAGPYGN